jgi:UDP-N-acetylglucosamine:LPS N-acetylglucosamine transferase
LFGLPIFDILLKLKGIPKPPTIKGKSIGNVWSLLFLLGMLNKRYIIHLVSELNKIIEAELPDLLVTELNAGAYISSKITGVPLMTTFANIVLGGKNSKLYKRSLKTVNKVLEHFNSCPINAPEELFMSPDVLKIIPSVPELDGFSENRQDVVFVGDLEDNGIPQVDDTQNKKRYIFVYMGVSGSIPIKKLKKVLQKVFGQYEDKICCVACPALKENLSIGNVQFHKYFPFNDIKAETELVISHGGLNTITESIRAKIPLLLFPSSVFEVRYNAKMVEQNLLGFMGEKSDFNEYWLTDKYEKCIQLAPEIAAFSKKYEQYSGSRQAVAYAEKWMNMYIKQVFSDVS